MTQTEAADLFLQWADERLLKLQSDLDALSATEDLPGQRQVKITCLYVKADLDAFRKQKELGVGAYILSLPQYKMRVLAQKRRGQEIAERALNHLRHLLGVI